MPPYCRRQLLPYCCEQSSRNGRQPPRESSSLATSRIVVDYESLAIERSGRKAMRGNIVRLGKSASHLALLISYEKHITTTQLILVKVERIPACLLKLQLTLPSLLARSGRDPVTPQLTLRQLTVLYRG